MPPSTWPRVILVAPPRPAGANFNGTTGILTAGDNYIRFEDGSTPLLPWFNGAYWMSDTRIKWSPDGSRAVYIDHLNGLNSVRYNNSYDLVFQWGFPAESGFLRQFPTYRSDGRSVVWSEKPDGDATAHWRLKITSSSPFGGVLTISPDDEADYTLADGGGSHGKVVFQRQVGTATPEIWIWDGTGLGAAHFSKITNGREPSLSPNGARIAYVDPVELTIWTANVDGSNAAPLVAHGSGLVWSADGGAIAYAETKHRDGSTRSPQRGGQPTLTALKSVPAYESSSKNAVTRLAGSSRWETAVAASQYLWKTAANAADARMAAQSVILSRSDTFADALGDAALAAAKRGPLLLTPPTSLDPATKTEIQRVFDTDTTKRVYILGSTGAISIGVENAIGALGYHVKRVAGADRYAIAGDRRRDQPEPGAHPGCHRQQFPRRACRRSRRRLSRHP